MDQTAGFAAGSCIVRQPPGYSNWIDSLSQELSQHILLFYCCSFISGQNQSFSLQR